jgi:hypothetical protein
MQSILGVQAAARIWDVTNQPELHIALVGGLCFELRLIRGGSASAYCGHWCGRIGPCDFNSCLLIRNPEHDFIRVCDVRHLYRLVWPRSDCAHALHARVGLGRAKPLGPLQCTETCLYSQGAIYI